jgi:hypothetical protein
MKLKHDIYGLMAEFDTPDELLAAAEKIRDAHFEHFDTYTSFPIHGLSEAMGLKKSWVSFIVLAGGITGCLGGFFMCWYANVLSYPLNIAGRPLNSWPAFIPITYECTILLACSSALFGMLILNGLPQPYHPVFNIASFQLASRDKFFAVIEAADKQFNMEKTRQFLETLKPAHIYEVPV